MKLLVKLLVLYAFYSDVWEATAFTPPIPITRLSPRTYRTGLGVAEKINREKAPFRERKKIIAPAPPILETITETPIKTKTDIKTDIKTEIDIKKKTKVAEKSKTKTSTKSGSLAAIKVHGHSLRTCSFDESVNRVHVFLKTDGRPMHARVELWHGPENTPQMVNVDVEDGSIRPFSCIVETPGEGNSIAIRNTGGMEFPLYACINADIQESGPVDELLKRTRGRIVQGQASYSVPCAPNVASVQLMINTNGGPLSAIIELLQGPNNSKQTMKVYTEEGLTRPFYVVVDTPGAGNVVRILNTAPIEYPFTAHLDAFLVKEPILDNGDPGIRWS